jgi:hypothetical protein
VFALLDMRADEENSDRRTARAKGRTNDDLPQRPRGSCHDGRPERERAMYLFTRATRVAPGHLNDATEWAIGITEKVRQITSLPVHLWASMFSPAVGTIAWTANIESLTELEDANAKLLVDDMFVDRVRQAAELTTGQLDDSISQFVHGGTSPAGDPGYAAVVSSVLANGAFARGIEVGVQIATRATEISGIPTSFLLGSTGTYGAVAWITTAERLADIEQGERTVNTDADFLRLVDEQAGPCYLPGATTQSIWQRLA